MIIAAMPLNSLEFRHFRHSLRKITSAFVYGSSTDKICNVGEILKYVHCFH